jgi:hypothetical protein
MLSRFGLMAVGAIAFASPLVVGSSSVLAQLAVPNTTGFVDQGGSVGGATNGVIEGDQYYNGWAGGSAVPANQPQDFSFNIFGASATQVGTTLNVTIFTNYANNVGDLSTGLGDLFIAKGTVPNENSSIYSGGSNLNGSPANAVPSSYQFAASSNLTTNTSNGTVYNVTASGSIKLSYASSGYYGVGVPVGTITPNATVISGVTDNVTINSGTTTSGKGYSNSGTLASDYAGDGSIVFSISNAFSPTGLDLSSLFTIIWAETCANDYIVATFNLPGTQETQTPLPAALPLFATGLSALGLFGWRRKRKAAIAA